LFLRSSLNHRQRVGLGSPMKGKSVIFLICAFLLSPELLATRTGKSDSLRQILSKGNISDTSRIRIGIDLARELTNQGLFVEALKQIEITEKLATAISDKRGIADAMFSKGTIYYLTGSFGEALFPQTQANKFYESINDKKGSAAALNGIGNIYFSLGQYDLSLSHYIKAYALREKLGDALGMASSLNNIANIFSEQKEYKKALDYHFRVIKIKRKLNSPKALAYSFNNISDVYSNLGDYDKGLKYLDSALFLFERIRFSLGIGYVLGNIGELREKQLHFTQAAHPLKRAAEIFKGLKDDKALAEALNHLGYVQLRLGDLAGSEKSLREAQNLAVGKKLLPELAENYLNFSCLDSAKGEMSNSNSWLRKYSSVKDEMFNVTKTTQIAQMQVAFESVEKDKTIDLLAKEKDIQKSEKKNQYIIFMYSIVFLVFIIMGLVFFIQLKSAAQKKLEKQKNQLVELHSLKDKLFSIISHDLRSPLQGLKGLLGIASRGYISDNELRPLLATINQNTGYTINLVDNLLAWSNENLKGNKMKPSPSPFDIYEIVRANIEVLSSQALAKGVVINNLCRSQMVYADKNMIDVVVRNLISNALKFSFKNGSVELRTNCTDCMVSLSVQDNGVGIPKDRIKNLFGALNFSTKGTSDEKGTGLGLVVCKDFIIKNGGSIDVKSESGKGTVFTVEIPRLITENAASLNEEIAPQATLETVP